jgi:hypothetical protein
MNQTSGDIHAPARKCLRDIPVLSVCSGQQRCSCTLNAAGILFGEMVAPLDCLVDIKTLIEHQDRDDVFDLSVSLIDVSF